MKDVHIALGVLALVMNGVAGLFGAWCWYQAEANALFWRLLRAGQASIVLAAADGGVWRLTGHKVSNIHLLMGVVDKLHKLYRFETGPMVPLRTLGLAAVDRFPTLKKFLMKTAAGAA